MISKCKSKGKGEEGQEDEVEYGVEDWEAAREDVEVGGAGGAGGEGGVGAGRAVDTAGNCQT